MAYPVYAKAVSILFWLVVVSDLQTPIPFVHDKVTQAFRAIIKYHFDQVVLCDGE